MKSRAWKTGKWGLTWNELSNPSLAIQGTCSFDESNGASLDIPFGDLSESRRLAENGWYAATLENEMYDSIVGVTQDGWYLALLDVVSTGVGAHYPGYTYESLQANTVLASKTRINPAGKYKGAKLGIAGLKEWVGCACETTQDDVMLQIPLHGTCHPMSLYESDGLRVELAYGTQGLTTTPELIQTKTYAHLTIHCEEATSLNDLWTEMVWPLQSAFAFFMGHFPALTYLHLTPESGGRSVEAYRTTFKATKQYKGSGCSPVSLARIGQQTFCSAVSAWLNMGPDDDHGCKVLTSLLGQWDMPFDLLLMAATTALESLARGSDSCRNTYDNETIKRLKSLCRDAVHDDQFKRIEGLLDQLKRPSYRMLLDAVYEECRPWSERLIPNWRLFRREQTSLCIQGAHGLTGTDNYELVGNHYYGQILLAYLVIMKRLGLGDETFREFFNSKFLNAARWRLREAYTKKTDGSPLASSR